jgi:hypothetical protein
MLAPWCALDHAPLVWRGLECIISLASLSVQRGKEGRSQMEKEAAQLVREALKSEKQAAKTQRKQVSLRPRRIAFPPPGRIMGSLSGLCARKNGLYVRVRWRAAY